MLTEYPPTEYWFCEHRLGIEDGSIPDHRITASSTYDKGDTSGNCQPSNGRLNQMGSGNVIGGWCASNNGPDKDASWLQVDFVEHVQVEGVIVQGINDTGALYGDWRVTAYSVDYSDDQNTWQYVKVTSSDTSAQVRSFMHCTVLYIIHVPTAKYCTDIRVCAPRH